MILPSIRVHDLPIMSQPYVVSSIKCAEMISEGSGQNRIYIRSIIFCGDQGGASYERCHNGSHEPLRLISKKERGGGS